MSKKKNKPEVKITYVNSVEDVLKVMSANRKKAKRKPKQEFNVSNRNK